MENYEYFNRDISWLYFNERVLQEAANNEVPPVERINFLSIYSSNLDEFYRVRMPVLMALKKINTDITDAAEQKGYYKQATEIIRQQQELFGAILTRDLIPALKENNIYTVYNEPIPDTIIAETKDYLVTVLASYTEIIFLKKSKDFFPENNKLYLAVALEKNGVSDIAMISIPSDKVSRFFNIAVDDKNYIVFIDDIIKANLSFIFQGHNIEGAYSIKITRDAELDLQDEYEGDIADKIEKQISKRDFGLATRFLYQPDMPADVLKQIVQQLKLDNAGLIAGGNYHNLKDLASFPADIPALSYPKQIPLPVSIEAGSLFDAIQQKDILINPPYQSYDTVFRFFNEAAMDETVEEIYTTLYRVANDSRIAHALITAAKNGKKVTAFVEVKARFDEANNIKWGKAMKAAGVRIIYSIPQLKVHAKVALVKKKENGSLVYLGLFGTGNLNESTARFYTDHILLTADRSLLGELELLFIFLSKQKKATDQTQIAFKHLLVAQFNLQNRFIELIDNEIRNAKKGRSSRIIIKVNNLEEEILINKLYEASNAGVQIDLIVRSVCRLKPGIKGQSEKITVRRIVDRYLEHARVFIFNNNNDELIFFGSADWMDRNIYRRIEVCLPLYDESIKRQIREMINLQLNDDLSAVMINENLENIKVDSVGQNIRAQEEIYRFLQIESENNP